MANVSKELDDINKIIGDASKKTQAKWMVEAHGFAGFAQQDSDLKALSLNMAKAKANMKMLEAVK